MARNGVWVPEDGDSCVGPEIEEEEEEERSNSEEKRMCQYKIGGLTMDAAMDATHRLAAAGSPPPESLQTGLQQLKMQGPGGRA
jgi:hypothetical protein